MVGSLSWCSSPLSDFGIMFTTSTAAAAARLARRERRAGARRAGRLIRGAAALFARVALVFRLRAMSASPFISQRQRRLRRYTPEFQSKREQGGVRYPR